MIPEAFIRQWCTQAPWQSFSMVEHDLVISRALVALFQNKLIANSLVFRGGTALNKLYLNPPARYSEDIDLVQMESLPIGPVLDAIREALSWLEEPKRKLTERSAKLIYKYTTFEEEPAKLKIEINTTEHFHIHPLKSFPFKVESEWYEGQADIRTYALEELMATKLRALYQRRKGRDLFDWWYILTQELVDIPTTLSFFDRYCQHEGDTVTRALFERNMALKRNHKDFCLDMHPLLPVDFPWNFEEAYDMVFQNLISQIPGEPWKGQET